MAEISDFEKLHTFVTWPDKPTEYFDNGNFTIGSLGFPKVNVSGSPNDGTCDPETVPVKIEPKFSYGYDTDPSIISQVCFRPKSNIDLENDTIVVNASSFKFTSTDSKCEMTLSDDVAMLLEHASTVEVIAIGDDDMESTKIPGSAVTNYSQADNVFECTLTTECENDYDLGEGLFGLSIALNAESIYILLNHQDDENQNGLYMYTESLHEGRMTWRKLGTFIEGTEQVSIDDRKDPSKYPPADPTANDNVGNCCDHFRKNYSDREVADYTEDAVGTATHFGVHPETKAQMDCAGNFIKWFTGDGIVDIGNAKQFPVYVNGFGLGEFYSSENGIDVGNIKQEVDTKLHPWLEWAYSSKWDAKVESNNMVALPRDWPFTYSGGNVSKTANNNITLITHADDGTDLGVGNLEYTDEDGNEVRIDRHHIVVYNDFSPNDDSAPSGYKSGSTVIKPLFIHIPAPIDTKDGDTFEVTVSLQNINTDQAFQGDNKEADLSAYYATLAQPRVYVMGGCQKFSTTRLNIVDPTGAEIYKDHFVLTTVGQILDAEGNPLPVDTEIRANLVSSLMTPAEMFFNGVIESTSETATVVNFKGTFPYKDIGGRRWRANTLSLCGIAYLDATEENNPVATSMGLLSRQSGILGSDYGRGSTGDIDEFNKFFSVTPKPDHVDMKGPDKRYVLATVYQTATSTFPWRLNDRRRIKHAALVMTDEFDRGDQSIVAQAWNLNKALLSDSEYSSITKTTVELTNIMTVSGYNFQPSTSPVSYGCLTSIGTNSAIGTKVNVAFPYTMSAGDRCVITAESGQPIRQAKHAYKALINDFLNMRGINGDTTVDVDTIPALKIGTGVAERTGTPSSSSVIGNGSLKEQGTSAKPIYKGSWLSRLRHLPEYVTAMDSYSTADQMGTTDKQNIAFPENDFIDYLDYSKYAYDSIYDSTSCTEDVDCSLIGVPSTGKAFAENSAVLALLRNGNIKGLDKQRLFHDMQRHAETKLIYKAPSIATNLEQQRDHSLNAMVWSPFAQVYSIDAVPCPTNTTDDLPELSDAQKIFVSADVLQQYRYECEEFEDMEYVSAAMPTSTALASFVKKYVSPIANNMRSHFYNSLRVILKNDAFGSADDPVYKRSVKWICDSFNDCDMGGELINRYINDSFATQATIDTTDFNIDYSYLKRSSDNKIAIENNMSAPPYSTNNSAWFAKHGDTYTRVFMQFTFSAQAGRWYTTDYRQYPTNYLTPLYGARTFNATLPTVYNEVGLVAKTNERADARVWRNSACLGYNGYKSTLYMPYSCYPSMDITLGCVPFLFNVYQYDSKNSLNPFLISNVDADWKAAMDRLQKPYLPIENGGLEVYPPSNANGEYSEATDDGIHANFWSVRQFLRPAVSVLAGTDIPGVDTRTGGTASDATLYGMFDFPVKGEVRYKLPSTADPTADMAKTRLVYQEGNDEENFDSLLHRTDGETGIVVFGISDEDANEDISDDEE